jgi:hypothetical protein
MDPRVRRDDDGFACWNASPGLRHGEARSDEAIQRRNLWLWMASPGSSPGSH